MMKLIIIVSFLSLPKFLWAYPQRTNVSKQLQTRQLYVNPAKHVDKFIVDPKITFIVDPKIINGHESIPHSHPSLAYLILSSFTQYWLCGGSLISRNFVLTAGHCTNGAHSAKVILGAHNTTDKEPSQVSIFSEYILTHPNYNEDGIQNDIGLIKLHESAKLNDNIQLVNLPNSTPRSDEYQGDIATVAGWGLTHGLGDASDVVREVSVQILPDKECKNFFNIYQDYELCTSGEDGKAACNGDSGGPLIVNGTQVGIVSYGVSYCQSGYPTVFTKVLSFLEWILKNSDAKRV